MVSDAPAEATGKRWRVKPRPPAVPEGDWPPLIGLLLAQRGVVTAAEARAFLDNEALAAPPALPDIDVAVERLAQACRDGETVAAYGDFDVDGVTSTALLFESLSALGAKPIPYLPHRVDEGYGLNEKAIGTLRALGATLLITADCGTSSIEEVAAARRMGMDVVILDHHTVPPHLPIATALVNPKRDPSSRNEPAACGIAYYVLRALHQALDRPADDNAMLELAALGTVCDLAPMAGDNRRLVRDGLRALARTERPGLRALLAIANGNGGPVDTETIGFGIGPRLNAAGRLAHARLAFDLLVCREEERAQEIAGELDALNRERRRVTESALALAEELMADEGDPPLIMLGHPEFSSGIVGLVASKLAESRQRPAIVYEQGEETSRASARSIEGFDVTGALRTCPELFERFGGHRMAAGFTAKNEHLPEIKERLLAHAQEQLEGVELTPAIDIDAELPLSELRGEEIRWLARLAPHGVGNPEPAFLSRGVVVEERRGVGQDGAHLRLKLRAGAVLWPAIAFRQKGDGIEQGARADIVYSLSVDRMHADAMQLRVIDLRPSD